MKTVLSSWKLILITIVLCALCGNAIASPASLNPGVENCDLLSSSLSIAARKYAKTGRAPTGFNPVHSRAWYATAMGLTPVLKNIIKKRPAVVDNPQLLAIAVSIKDSDPLRVFLDHGANPNTYVDIDVRNGPVTVLAAHGPLIMIATSCNRPVNLLYLLKAGANVYAYTTYNTYKARVPAKMNAMAIAAIGTSLRGPFTQDIMLLLAAGYDPRCPVAAKKVTAMSIIEHSWNNLKRSGYSVAASRAALKTAQGNKRIWILRSIQYYEKLKETHKLLKGILSVVAARSSTPPHCRKNSRPDPTNYP